MWSELLPQGQNEKHAASVGIWTSGAKKRRHSLARYTQQLTHEAQKQQLHSADS